MNPKEIGEMKIWLTGASRGIGAAIARRLVDTGATLILSSKEPDSMKNLMKEYSDKPHVYLFPCNLLYEEQIDRAFEKIKNTVGEPDVLINNAGTAVMERLSKLSIHDFDEMVGVNLIGPFLCIKKVLPSMLEKKNGVIINIVSCVAIKTFKKSSVYAATKAGLLAMSRSLREEVRKDGIKVIDILPGATETDIWSDAEKVKFHESMMQPEDIAETIAAALNLALNERIMIEEIVLRPQGGDL